MAQAATPFAFRWLPPVTVYALGLVFIAAVYIGFSVADGRWKVIAAETTVATVFVVVAAAAVIGPQFVTGTRWWPPSCAAVDFVAAAILAIALAAGADFR